MASKYILHYWDLPGRAEPIRCAFYIAGIDFEDKLYGLVDYEKMKSDNKMYPLGQLPTLEVDGEVSVQSCAILRYIATEHDLYGKTSKERLRVDQVMYTALHIVEKLSDAYFWKPNKEEKVEQLKKLFEDYVPRACKMFEAMLEKREDNDGFFLGNKITIADILLFNTVEMIQLEFNLEDYRKAADGYPLLNKLLEKIKRHDKMKEYLEKRGPLIDLYKGNPIFDKDY